MDRAVTFVWWMSDSGSHPWFALGYSFCFCWCRFLLKGVHLDSTIDSTIDSTLSTLQLVAAPGLYREGRSIDFQMLKLPMCYSQCTSDRYGTVHNNVQYMTKHSTQYYKIYDAQHDVAQYMMHSTQCAMLHSTQFAMLHLSSDFQTDDCAAVQLQLLLHGNTTISPASTISTAATPSCSETQQQRQVRG